MYKYVNRGKHIYIKNLRGFKMIFIGIISEYNSFENIKDILKNNYIKDIKLIHINKNSIENIKNIKFETLIIDSNLKDYQKETEIIKEIAANAKYLILNTDINILTLEIKSWNANLITYGLNRKATITISSISESGILIYLQRNLKDTNGDILEIGEDLVRVSEKSKLKIYEILIVYTILLIKQKSIIKELQENSNFFEQN